MFRPSRPVSVRTASGTVQELYPFNKRNPGPEHSLLIMAEVRALDPPSPSTPMSSAENPAKQAKRFTARSGSHGGDDSIESNTPTSSTLQTSVSDVSLESTSSVDSSASLCDPRLAQLAEGPLPGLAKDLLEVGSPVSSSTHGSSNGGAASSSKRGFFGSKPTANPRMPKCKELFFDSTIGGLDIAIGAAFIPSEKDQDRADFQYDQELDTHVITVFDGHGTTDAAAEISRQTLGPRVLECLRQGFAGENALRNAFAFTDDRIRALHSSNRTGTTATSIILRKTVDSDEWEMTAGWVGDSRCAKLGSDGELEHITRDHRLSSESEMNRVQELAKAEAARSPEGARVTSVARRECKATGRTGPIAVFNEVSGISLTTTRSLGDHTASPAIVCTPEITTSTIGPYMRLVVASDGLWDAVTDKAAALLLKHSSRDCRKAAKKLGKAAFSNMTLGFVSRDDICVVVVDTFSGLGQMHKFNRGVSDATQCEDERLDSSPAEVLGFDDNSDDDEEEKAQAPSS